MPRGRYQGPSGPIGPTTMTTDFRGRVILMLPTAQLREWHLFTARCAGGIKQIRDEGGSLVDLVTAVEQAAALFGMTASMRDGDPDGPIEFEVRAQ